MNRYSLKLLSKFNLRSKTNDLMRLMPTIKIYFHFGEASILILPCKTCHFDVFLLSHSRTSENVKHWTQKMYKKMYLSVMRNTLHIICYLILNISILHDMKIKTHYTKRYDLEPIKLKTQQGKYNDSIENKLVSNRCKLHNNVMDA